MTLTVADRVELADLVARYAATVDDRSLIAATTLFTDDAVLAMPSPPEDLEPSAFHEGRTAITGALRAVDAFQLTQHAIVGHIFDGTEETASGRVTCVAHHLGRRSSGEVSNLVWHMHYVDNYRRHEGVWRFARRAVYVDWIETRTPRRWRVGDWSGNG